MTDCLPVFVCATLMPEGIFSCTKGYSQSLFMETQVEKNIVWVNYTLYLGNAPAHRSNSHDFISDCVWSSQMAQDSNLKSSSG